jgi:hypothetical protein
MGDRGGFGTSTGTAEPTGKPRRQRERRPVSLLLRDNPLVRQVLTEQDIDDRRHDGAGPLVELLFGEIGDRVRHS